MSGTAKTYRAKMSDGTVIEIRNAAGWDVYSFAKGRDGKWRDICRGGSANSVRARTRTALGHHNFEIHRVTEIMPKPVEKYFEEHPSEIIRGQRVAIQQVFVEGLGWVSEIPGGYWPGSKATDKAFQPRGCRPTRSFCRLLATVFNVKAIAVGTPYLSADFQMTELGLRLPKRSAA